MSEWEWSDEAVWPPQCCVSAYIYAALSHHGIRYANPSELPALLETSVRPTDANPLGLPVTTDDSTQGVTAAKATRTLGHLLADIAPTIGFRHLPLKVIPLGLYDEILEDALKRGLTVGVGVDVSLLDLGEHNVPVLHVFRVHSFDRHQITLFDDSKECAPPTIKRSWERIEQAILAAADGFWLIGPEQELAFAAAPCFRTATPGKHLQ
jgi:hypothetical protein